MVEDRSRRWCEKLRWTTTTIMLLKFNFISQNCLSVYVSYYLQILFKVSLKTKNHKNRPQVKSDSNHVRKTQFESTTEVGDWKCTYAEGGCFCPTIPTNSDGMNLLLKPTETHSSLSCPEDVWFTWGSKWIIIERKKQAGEWSWMSRTCSREGSGFGPGVRSLPVRSWEWRLPASRAASWKDHMTISLPNMIETLQFFTRVSVTLAFHLFCSEANGSDDWKVCVSVFLQFHLLMLIL